MPANDLDTATDDKSLPVTPADAPDELQPALRCDPRKTRLLLATHKSVAGSATDAPRVGP